MKALESQINAHFLYNTLEAINSLAEIEGAEDISVMALALGDMFRYSIKTKGALVTLEKELAHVRILLPFSRSALTMDFALRWMYRKNCTLAVF